MTELGDTDETTTAESVPNQLARWAFGGPISPRDYAVVRHAWARRGLLVEDLEVQATVRELTALVAQDRDLMVASRRWRPGHPDPELFWPGDVVALRALAVYGTLREADVVLNPRLAALAGPADEPTRSALQGHLSYARLLYRAQPFFLPAATAVGLMASHPPDEASLAELRLPFASVAVYFGADLHAGEDTLIWPPETQPRLAEAKASIPDVGLGAELGQTIVLNLARLGSYASGVVLFSRPDGGLADEMLWLLATDPDPDSADASLDRLRAVLPAYRSRATLAPLVANIAAAVAWASWRTEPPLALPARDSKHWRKAVRTSQFRKLEPRGAAAGVRVLDVTSRTVSRTNNASAAGGSPVTHRRRGHWHRVRVGPRQDWHHEWRWYHDMVVNPDGRADTRLRVYRLPTPAEGPSPQPPPTVTPPASPD
jgi:hypothetical protein